MTSPADPDAIITEFCGLTGVAAHEARQYLEANQWDLSSAAAEYYTSLDEGTAEGDAAVGQRESGPVPTTASGERRIPDSNPLPQAIPTTSSAAPPASSSSKAPSNKKFATLGDLGGGGTGHAGHGHDHDDDSDDSDENQDFFAGGEKSGLAVQNPDDLKRKILEKAKKNLGRPGVDDPRPASSRFTGTARTLGGDDTPSQVIEDPHSNVPQRPPPVERHLHFWADGFSVGDGPLYRMDDPANAGHLSMIKSGRAPLEIMNVERNQEVDVKLVQHSEKYVTPKKKYQPFSGGGQRLGSPTPGEPSSDPNPPPTPAALPRTIATSSSEPVISIDASVPTISLQIRLGDGTRLVSRFNTTHTIGDVYSFVNSSSPASRSRAWILMTTFPSKELSDQALTLGESAELKKGGVVVQRWS
ncbi:hypothetical protein MMC14_009428 [Varicellaria rhodocarpa]|nr:hypothetical protein [Varicellaria rhodocarpa]